MLVVQNSLLLEGFWKGRYPSILLLVPTDQNSDSAGCSETMLLGPHRVIGSIFKPVTPGQSLWGRWLGREDGAI